ncbi:MAG: BPSS1780 family membrane protein [Candidatus Methylopumilus sp.]|nr:BPSS1780 family membrane protein [Candidatus Methylopumilus sp.]
MKKITFRDSIRWNKESFKLFKKTPNQSLMLSLAYLFIFMLLPSMPMIQIFSIASILIWPIFLVFAVNFYKTHDKNKEENFLAVFEKIKPRLTTLLMLGFICLIYAAMVTMVLNSEMQGFIQLSENNNELVTVINNFLPMIGKLILLLLPLLMATWFSPMLIVYNNYSLFKSIKSSIAGCLMYIFPLGLSWLIFSTIAILFMLSCELLIGALASLFPAIGPSLMGAIIFFALLVITSVMFAFQYISYRDIFKSAKSY